MNDAGGKETVTGSMQETFDKFANLAKIQKDSADSLYAYESNLREQSYREAIEYLNREEKEKIKVKVKYDTKFAIARQKIAGKYDGGEENPQAQKAIAKLEKYYKRKEQLELRLVKRRIAEENRLKLKQTTNSAAQSFSSGNIWQAIRTLQNDTDHGGLEKTIAFMGSLAKQLEKQVDTIAGKKSAIDTRMQGSKNATQRDYITGGNSY